MGCGASTKKPPNDTYSVAPAAAIATADRKSVTSSSNKSVTSSTSGDDKSPVSKAKVRRKSIAALKVTGLDEEEVEALAAIVRQQFQLILIR